MSDEWIAALSFAVYIFPWIIANARQHKNSGAIFMLTLFTGWTVVGWVAAIVWSMTSNVAEKKSKEDVSKGVGAEATSGASDSVKYCTSCGNSMKEGSLFCPQCGNRNN